ncbi:asparaginase [Chitinilyticum litopenaei]|uniref:asparaginase n=1 Tax=Chitinilyticum litopenaei TaxID=1121276 RepID=UPI00040B0054|nr:asparaginase [Chitinilyticum litopenaei]
MQRVFCLYTGGTIGCVPGADGLRPAPDGMAERLATEAGALGCALSFAALPELLDSSCMLPADWHAIACRVATALAEHDAVLVLHGTDTMAYTAAALSFLLDGLARPVVLTGSQRPWGQEGSDAPANVRLALESALAGQAGVWLAFGGKLLPGRHVHKVAADADDAFAAPNAPVSPLAEVMPHPAPLRVRALDPTLRVLAVRLYPGSAAWLAAALRHDPPDALLLECYGTGNLPDDPALAVVLRELAGGIPLVACSQCLSGEVQLGRYQAGSLLAELGALPAGRLGAPACLAQLHVLLSTSRDAAELRQLWQTG